MKSMRCEACRRMLSINYFGVSRSSSTGYRPECKNCNTYRRNRTYRKRAPKDASVHQIPLTIYPLREQTRIILDSLPGLGTHSINATHLDSGEARRIVVGIDTKEIYIDIYKFGGGERETGFVLVENNLEKFIEYAITFLINEGVRPHLTEELDI